MPFKYCHFTVLYYIRQNYGGKLVKYIYIKNEKKIFISFGKNIKAVYFRARGGGGFEK